MPFVGTRTPWNKHFQNFCCLIMLIVFQNLLKTIHVLLSAFAQPLKYLSLLHYVHLYRISVYTLAPPYQPLIPFLFSLYSINKFLHNLTVDWRKTRMGKITFTIIPLITTIGDMGITNETQKEDISSLFSEPPFCPEGVCSDGVTRRFKVKGQATPTLRGYIRSRVKCLVFFSWNEFSLSDSAIFMFLSFFLFCEIRRRNVVPFYSMKELEVFSPKGQYLVSLHLCLFFRDMTDYKYGRSFF